MIHTIHLQTFQTFGENVFERKSWLVAFRQANWFTHVQGNVFIDKSNI